MATTRLPVTSVTPSNISDKVIIDYPDACVILSAISCLLSIFGSLGIFCTFALLPEIRNVTRKLIVCLTAADFLTASGVMISVYRYARVPTGSGAYEQLPVLCHVQSVITTYSAMVSFFLTAFIGVHLAVTVVQRRDRTGTTLAFVVFNVISWTVPGVVTGVAIYEGVLGEDRSITAGTGPWCWIDPEIKRPILWMLVTGKAWEILCFLTTVSIYVLIKYYQYLYYKRTDLHGIHASLRNDDNNVLYLWFVLYVLRIWGTLRFLIFAIEPQISKHEYPMAVLLYLQSVGDPAQAFCNFTLLCVFDKTVKKHMKLWYDSFRRRVSCYCCCTRRDGDNTNVKEPLVEPGGASPPMYDSVMIDNYEDNIRICDASNQRLTSSELVSIS